MADQGISNRGGGGCGASHHVIEFLWTGKCFDTPQQIPYVFVVRVENKIHIWWGIPGSVFVVKNHNQEIYKLFCHVTTEDNKHNSFNLYHLLILLMEMMTFM